MTKTPKNWEIKDIVKDNFWVMPATPKFVDNGEVPYITSKNIRCGKIDFNKVKYISKSDYAELSKNRPILEGDILVSMIGTLGEVAQVREDDLSFYGQNVYLIRLNEELINSEYFLHYFDSKVMKEYFESIKKGSTQGYLKTKDIETVKIPKNSIDEQKRIVAKLDDAFEKIDLAIKNTEQQLKDTKELFQSTLNQTFSNDEWEIKDLGDICEVIAGQSPKGDTYNTDGKGMPFHQGKKDYGEKYLAQNTKWTTSPTKVISAGSIVMSVRAPVGPVNFTVEEICIGRGLAGLISGENLDKEFLYYYLVCNENNIANSIPDGAVFGGINRDTIKSIKIPFPIIDEQKQIVKKLDNLSEKAQQLEKLYNQKLSDLTELKQSILQSAFNGEL